MGTVVTTGFGAASLDALARALDPDGDPLSPGLVVCGGPLVAVGVRRALGARTGGIAGVDFLTFDRLIEDLSQPALASVGQHQASPLELQAAVRAELASHPGLFGSVAAHRTTEQRLLQLDGDVIGLPPEEFERLASTPGLSGDAFRVLSGAARRLGAARVAAHVVELAVDRIESDRSWSPGPIVVYLPEPTRPSEGRVLGALARRPDCTVIVGLTGHADVDRRHRDRLSGWGLQGVSGPAPEPATGRVLEVADPDDEVRSALREIVAWAASGTPLPRMALLYTATDPYASLIEESLLAAGLPFSAPGHRALGTSLAGRTLQRLLALATRGLERSSVITLLASAPIAVETGRWAPVSQWDRLSRQAGVVDGDDWQPRLSNLAMHLDSAADRVAVIELRDFIAELERRLHPAEHPETWMSWANWARQLLGSLLRPDGSWPAIELVALERVRMVLEQLRTLDRFDARPSFDVFAATVVGELEALNVPGHPVGGGLVVAPVQSVGGLGFDRVAVVGLSEGTFPRPGREDSLLPDQARAQAGGWLLPKSAVPHLDVRALTSVVAAAANRTLLTTARGDLRSRRSKAWPLVLDHLIGERLELESHHRGLVDHGRPVSVDDVGLRSLVRHTDGGDPVHTHRLARDDGVLAAGLARHLDRNKGALTAHTGKVGAGLVDPTRRPLSPTAIEDYAACPRKYLFGRVLRLSEEERPERIEEITARDRGSLVHKILERFLSEVIAQHQVPEPDERWSARQTARMLALLDESVEMAAEQGVTGGRVQTEILRRDLGNEVLRFLTTDNETRAERQSRPFAVEMAFGFEPDEPRVVELGDRRKLLMRGVVDRVDLTDDDGLLVIDYKGGSAGPFAKMSDDPLKGGRRLQLPLYARILAEQLDREGPRTALYWLTKHNQLKPMPLDDRLEEELNGHIGAALDGISDGLFPGIPGGTVGWPRLTFENCRYCDFDRVCPTDRQREWDEVQDDEALTPIDLLLGRGGEHDS